MLLPSERSSRNRGQTLSDPRGKRRGRSIRTSGQISLHFVGIGGIGMCGIAEVLFNQGYLVSGSDLHSNETTERLERIGVRVSIGHGKENVEGATVVVVSSAIPDSNPEVVEAKRLRIPVVPRAEMLGELMRGKTGIAVAGTHGKTTTTSIVSTLVRKVGLDPTCVIGGKVDSIGGSAILGRGEYVVVEADESDGSFLQLPTTYGVITNIDNDHLDHYGNVETLERAFIDFVGKLPFYGSAIVCGDDPGVQRCIGRFQKPFKTYGLSDSLDYSIQNLDLGPAYSEFDVLQASKCLGRVRLAVPGRHNALNALAAIALVLELGVPFEEAKKALDEYRGVKRRFEPVFEDKERAISIVDDYAHHPAEIVSTLATARRFWDGRIVSVFQPHRYTRTLHCLESLLLAFRESDVVLLTDIYAAGEKPIEGVSTKILVDKMKEVALEGQTIEAVGDLEGARARVSKLLKRGDLVLCLGAGSISKLPTALAETIRAGKFS